MLSQINILITRQELDPNLARGSFCLGAIYGIIWHHNHHVGPHSKDVILNRVIQYLKNRSMSGFQTWIDSLNKVKREISAISLSKSLEGSIFWSIYWCRCFRWNYKRWIWVENWVSVPCIGCQCYSRPLWGENGLRPASYCLQMDQNFSVTNIRVKLNGPNLKKTRQRKVQPVTPYCLQMDQTSSLSQACPHLGQVHVQQI